VIDHQQMQEQLQGQQREQRKVQSLAVAQRSMRTRVCFVCSACTGYR